MQHKFGSGFLQKLGASSSTLVSVGLSEVVLELRLASTVTL